MQATKIEDLVGHTIQEVEGLTEHAYQVSIHCDTASFMLEHQQECCENVRLVDFELQGTLKGEVLKATCVSNDQDHEQEFDSATWTFYNITTATGSLNMRWLGESNGYYSEAVNIEKRPPSSQRERALAKDVERLKGCFTRANMQRDEYLTIIKRAAARIENGVIDGDDESVVIRAVYEELLKVTGDL